MMVPCQDILVIFGLYLHGPWFLVVQWRDDMFWNKQPFDILVHDFFCGIVTPVTYWHLIRIQLSDVPLRVCNNHFPFVYQGWLCLGVIDVIEFRWVIVCRQHRYVTVVTFTFGLFIYTEIHWNRLERWRNDK